MIAVQHAKILVFRISVCVCVCVLSYLLIFKSLTVKTNVPSHCQSIIDNGHRFFNQVSIFLFAILCPGSKISRNLVERQKGKVD